MAVGRPFVRSAYEPGPGASKISELILALGRSDADRERRRGDLTAGLAANAGNIIAQAAGNIGNYYQNKPRADLEKLQVQQATKQMADQKDAEDALAKAGSDYKSAILQLEADHRPAAAELLRTKLAQRQSAQLDGAIKSYELKGKQYEEANRLLSLVKTDPAQWPNVQPQLSQIAESLNPGWGQMVPQHYDPKAVAAFDDFTLTEKERAERLKNNIEASEKQRQGVKTQNELDDWALISGAQHFALLDPKQATKEDFDGTLEFLKSRNASPNVLAAFGTSPQEAIANSQRILTQKARDKDAADGDMSFDEFLTAKLRDAGKAVPPTGRPQDAFTSADLLKFKEDYESAKRAKPEEGDVVASMLTPETTDMLAHQFAMTGNLPPMGMGKAAAGARAKVMNRAAEMYKSLDLPSQIAAFNSNKKALEKRTEQRSNLRAFEATAMANLDRFLDAASKISDSGSPWVNQVWRKVSKNGFGNADLAAYEAARQLVIPELSRIATNPNLAGVLSDSARNETGSLMAGDYTFKQLVAAAKMVKADAMQRGDSLDQEIQGLGTILASPPKQKTDVAPPPKAVEDLLKGKPDNTYTLSDGSTWVVRGGVITKKGGE